MSAYVAPVPEMSPKAAQAIVALLQSRAGITIPADRTDLLRNRLIRRLRALRLDDFDSYLRLLEGPSAEAEAPLLVEALTTHTTSFFREGRQYQWLGATGLPELAAKGVGVERDLILWSAACSTGAEIWSAAMMIEEYGRRSFRPLSYRGTGTDISRAILAKAEAAVYTEAEIDGVPQELRRTYLMKSRPGREGSDGRPVYRIVPEMRARVAFLQANLVALDTAPRIFADVAFLRNVLIYFDRETQGRIVRGVVSRLRPGGFLFTGHAEALPELPDGLVTVASSIYRKDV